MPLTLIKRLVLGHKLTPAQMDQDLTDIENAINGFEAELAVSLNPDGTLKANSVATAAIQDRAVTLAKLAFLSSFYAVDAGAVNALSISFTPPATAYADGMVFWVKPIATNTMASTLDVDGLGATPIKKASGGALVDVIPGEIVAGSVHGFVYVAPNFIILNPTFITTTYTPVVLTVLNNSGANWPVPALGTALPIPHTMGVVPAFVRVVAVCVNPANGYMANDEVGIETFIGDGSGSELDWAAFTVCADAAAITVARTSAIDQIAYNAKGGGYVASWNPNNWKIKAYILNV
jgi:hypothetical protein